MDRMNAMKFEDESYDHTHASPSSSMEGRAYLFASPEYCDRPPVQKPQMQVEQPPVLGNAAVTVRKPKSGTSTVPLKTKTSRQKKAFADENIGSNNGAPSADTTSSKTGQPKKARKVLAQAASTSSKATSAGTGQAKPSLETVLTCYRCNVYIKGPDARSASREMDKHLKECGLIICVLCNKSYKSVQTLQMHQRKAHLPAKQAV